MGASDLQDLDRTQRIQKLFDFDPFPYQEELIRHAQTTDITKAALKPGRQVGKSTLGGLIAAERALSGYDVLILAPFETTTEDMMESARDGLETAEDKFGEAGYTLGTTKRNKTDWEFQNGGRLRSMTVGSSGDQIRGKNPRIVLVDEAAYIDDSIFRQVIKPYFSTHESYEFYLFSTPAGKSGFFYEKVVNDDDYYSPHWPSRISPLITQDYLEGEREKMDSLSYAQEYEGEFIDEGESLFPYEEVKPLKGTAGELGERRWLGVDVARGGRDRTVYTEIDEAGNVNIAGVEETSSMDGVLGRIRDLHREHEYERIVVEENSIGGGVVDFGQGLGDVIHAFTSTVKSKHKLYKRLKKDVEDQNISLPAHRRLINEMTSLQFDHTANGYLKVSHPEDGHDDHPDSLAFANWGRHGVGQTEVVRRKGTQTQTGSTL